MSTPTLLLSRRCALALGFAATYAAPTLVHAAWESRELAGTSVEVYTPDGTSPIGDGRSLLVGLHGCTQTAVQLRDYAALEDTADAFGMVMALPLVPNGGVVAGCWDYYGAEHTRTSGHNGALVEITEALRDDAALGIDAGQMYVAGLSSGGGQALVIGCLAPDLFAGVGVIAGPSVGTTALQIGFVSTTAAEAADVCEGFAGRHADQLATQLAVTFTDTSDFTVAQGYAQINADMFASLYGEGLTTAESDMAALAGDMPTGTVTQYDDDIGGRVSALSSTSGTGHAWPAGTGTNGPVLSYVSGDGVDFVQHAAEFFTANARRVDLDPPGGDESGTGDDGGSEADGSEGADDAPGSDDGGDDAGDDGSADAADSLGDDAPGSDDGGDDATGSEGSGGSEGAGQDDESGCGCNQRPSGGGFGLAMMVVLGVVRRRSITS